MGGEVGDDAGFVIDEAEARNDEAAVSDSSSKVEEPGVVREAADDVVASGGGRPANNRSFVNVTSNGFDAEITATTPVGMKKALGG